MGRHLNHGSFEGYTGYLILARKGTTDSYILVLLIKKVTALKEKQNLQMLC
jgi:hypothetical protein